MKTGLASTDHRLPAYARLRDALAARIASGEWTPARPIPSEQRLAREYGLSVGTVRKGVDGLVGEGLLERRQGSGTFVRAPSFDASLFRFFRLRSSDGAELPIPSSRLILRSVATAPEEAAQALGTRDVIQIARLRSLADLPVLFEEICIPRARFDGFEALPASVFGPLLYPLYFERFGVFVKRAVDELSFDQATETVAKHLDIDEDAPLAVIRRTAFDIEEKPIEWRVARGDATRFYYRTELA